MFGEGRRLGDEALVSSVLRRECYLFAVTTPSRGYIESGNSFSFDLRSGGAPTFQIGPREGFRSLADAFLFVEEGYCIYLQHNNHEGEENKER